MCWRNAIFLWFFTHSYTREEKNVAVFILEQTRLLPFPEDASESFPVPFKLVKVAKVKILLIKKICLINRTDWLSSVQSSCCCSLIVVEDYYLSSSLQCRWQKADGKLFTLKFYAKKNFVTADVSLRNKYFLLSILINSEHKPASSIEGIEVMDLWMIRRHGFLPRNCRAKAGGCFEFNA